MAAWKARSGKVAEVSGILGHLSSNLQNRNEQFLVNSEFSRFAMLCETLFPPNWRQASPGRKVTVVGLIKVNEDQSGGANVTLEKAHIMATSGEPNIAVTAEELGKEAAKQAEFEKKWKVPGKYYYMTGKIKSIDKIPLSGGVSYKFRIDGGKLELYCNIQNERGVNANPPKPGDTVTVLVDCQSVGGGQIQMSGVYVDKQ